MKNKSCFCWKKTVTLSCNLIDSIECVASNSGKLQVSVARTILIHPSLFNRFDHYKLYSDRLNVLYSMQVALGAALLTVLQVTGRNIFLSTVCLTSKETVLFKYPLNLMFLFLSRTSPLSLYSSSSY